MHVNTCYRFNSLGVDNQFSDKITQLKGKYQSTCNKFKSTMHYIILKISVFMAVFN